jgi:ferredoxin
MKVKRNIIEIDEELCNGCGECITSCAEGALEIIDGKAKLVSERYCDGLGACLSGCPTGALKVIQRDADDFDEDAVHDRLEELQKAEGQKEQTLACGCPSATLQTFARPICPNKGHEEQSEVSSSLRHWPVQIRLVPPTAAFLKNADLLIAADCTPIAYPAFHRDFLEGKAVMIGCPKFDDAQAYVEKFAQIFNANTIKSVTVVVMEVPCCSGLPLMVKKGMELAGKTVPVEQIVISSSGEILRKQKLVA